MGGKEKAQRPKKRKMLTHELTGDGKAPPRRKRKEVGAPKADQDIHEDVLCVEEEAKEKVKRDELAALETLLFGAPTLTAAVSDSEAVKGPPESLHLTKRKRRKDSSGSSDPPVDVVAEETVEDAAAATTADATEAAESGAEAAWVDPEDARMRIDIETNPKLRKLKQRKGERFISGEEYQRRLKNLHNKLIGKRQGLEWIEQARIRKRQAETEAQEAEGPPIGLSATGQEGPLITGEQLVLSSWGGLRSKREGGAPLPSAKIRIRRLEDANKQGISLCAISALEFHPESNILLTSGRDKTLRLFLVDGKKNPVLESLHLKDFPVISAGFNKQNKGNTILLTSNATRTIAEFDIQQGKVYQIPGIGGRREERCFHHLCLSPGIDSLQSSPIVNTFAVASATSQSVLLCDANSKRLLNVLKMNAPVAGMVYHPYRPNSFLTADAEASVYEWDIRTGCCLSRFTDTAALRLTSFAVSPPPPPSSSSPNYSTPPAILAIGSRTGYTDLFQVPEEGTVSAKPFKTLGNLTTAVTALCFNPTNEVLCAASKWKKDALKLVHVSSGTVFQNWPTERTPMHYVTAANFSKQNGLLAVGNDTGKVLLYQLRHYT